MKQADFRKTVWDFYERSGRHNLPWRNTRDPYAIYVSEIMLQQTQADRVIPKYEAWLERFPDFAAAATADTAEILSHWQGLGYNRRALYIQKTAVEITENHGGTLPSKESALRELPGIGPYTAGALQAFVFEKPVVFVETNIRTVFIHHFFADAEGISDEAIKKTVGETLPDERIREWYWALMDYGNHLKATVGNLNSKSRQYQKQSKFSGSNRQLRSKLTRFILAHQPVSHTEIEATFNKLVAKHERMKPVAENLSQLEKEGFLTNNDGRITTSK